MKIKFWFVLIVIAVALVTFSSLNYLDSYKAAYNEISSSHQVQPKEYYINHAEINLTDANDNVRVFRGHIEDLKVIKASGMDFYYFSLIMDDEQGKVLISGRAYQNDLMSIKLPYHFKDYPVELVLEHDKEKEIIVLRESNLIGGKTSQGGSYYLYDKFRANGNSNSYVQTKDQ